MLTSQIITGHRILVLGDGGLAKRRTQTVRESGGVPVVIGSLVEGVESYERDYSHDDLTTLGRDETGQVVDSVFVCYGKTKLDISTQISLKCRQLRIPVNVVDEPDLCTFTLLSTHIDGNFKLGISTSGTGCRLANRLRRHVVSSLPPGVAAICNNVGALRKQIQQDDDSEEPGQQDDDAEQNSRFNKLVLADEQKKQRLRWLSQIVEYFPLDHLAAVNISDLSESYASSKTPQSHLQSPKGRIALVGAGPGSEGLLTTAALRAINSADLILTDKLVPQAVLDLIPRRTPVQVAKKFPGNADKAQEELLATGLAAALEGKYVVRLKQGDPYIFGRGAEEYVFFSEHGFKPEVICGVTSALSAPLLANIPATHRNVADQVLFMTGTGRGGALPNFPEYVDSRTCVFLMALHRISTIVEALQGKNWSLDVPCCVIERSSCADQRIIRTTLRHVVEAIEQLGSRPPGLLVTGRACQVIEKLPEGEKWIVEEGL